MLRIVVDIDCPACDAQGAKEAVAMALERIGNCRVVAVQETKNEQLRMEGDR